MQHYFQLPAACAQVVTDVKHFANSIQIFMHYLDWNVALVFIQFQRQSTLYAVVYNR